MFLKLKHLYAKISKKYDVSDVEISLSQAEFESCSIIATSKLCCQCVVIFLVSSVTSTSSIKHDPDLLKADIALSKTRVARLARELNDMKSEMKLNEAGVRTLQQ